MDEWHISHEDLAKLMGPGATEADAEDMADLLTTCGYTTRLTSQGPVPVSDPVPQAVWEDCLLALVAVHAR